jgi:pimeloyl-ACP methyl ester carboxylesterase
MPDVTPIAPVRITPTDAPTGIPVVFLHGIGGSARAWAPQLESFARAGLRPVALDLPGFGERPAVEAMQFEDLAADVEAAVDGLALDPPVLVGHSFGGMVAQTCVRRKPRGYRALVLVGTSPAFGNPAGDFQKQFVADRLRPLEEGAGMRELAAASVLAMMGKNPDPAGRALAIEVMGTVPVSTYRAAVRCLVAFDERANLPAIAVPVLCLAGEHDRNAPAAMMEKMAAKIRGARYVCLPGVGHLPNLEAPQAFDAAVTEFLTAARLGGQDTIEAPR